MAMTPDLLYAQLGRLVADTPDLLARPVPVDTHRWLGRAAILAEETGDRGDLIALKVAAGGLHGPLMLANSQTIIAVVHRALAKAEMNAPVGMQGAYIAAGHTLDAFAAVGRVLSQATREVMLVDPYADQKICTDFAVLAPENTSIRILTDEKAHYATLRPALDAWSKQYGSLRPIEVRLAAARALHDRAILVDGKTAWTIGQSFKDLAARAMTSIVRDDDEAAVLKIAALDQLWDQSTPL
jgi:hypothetical protein